MPTEAEKAAYAAKYYAPKEKSVETLACEYAKSLGFWHTKYKSANNRGLPDRQFKHIDCREFYIEFKKRGKKARAQQRLVIDEMREHGFLVFVTDDLGEAKAIIHDMLVFGHHHLCNS